MGSTLIVNGTSHIVENFGVTGTFNNPICMMFHSVAVDPIASQTYGAEIDLDSHGKVLNGSDVLFEAENEISLDIDFEVEAGATFEATINLCGN